ncbi:hypothetical protein D3C81_1256880 [compost metagenome]
MTSVSHICSIGIKYALVMCFTNVRVQIHDIFRKFKAVSFTSGNNHPDAAVRTDRALERRGALHTNDLFFVFVKVSRSMGSNGRRRVNVNIQYAASFSFFLGQARYDFPQGLRVSRSAFQERFVTDVRRDVRIDEILGIHLIHPFARFEASPCVLHFLHFFFDHRHLYSLHFI